MRVLLAVLALAGAAPSPGPDALVHAIPAIEAYNAAHLGYAGAVKKLHVRGVTIVRATRTTYCIESGGYFKNGPAAQIYAGSCAHGRTAFGGDGIIRAAVPVLELYADAHGGYAGLTAKTLLKADDRLYGLHVVRADAAGFCVETGAAPYWLVRPIDSFVYVLPGRCQDAS